MEMTGEYPIPAPQEAVWAALNDPAILRQCIPGCERVDRLSDTEMEAVAVAKVGPVKAKFSGKVTLSNLNPPHAYTISGEGKGGAAGFAKGGADVTLEANGDGTVLRYAAKATVGGKLAQIGQRLIDSSAKKMADDFFGTFTQVVAAQSPAPADSEAPIDKADEAAPPAATPSGAPESSREPHRELNPLIWMTGLAVLIIALIALSL